jgi:DNA polymerase I
LSEQRTRVVIADIEASGLRDVEHIWCVTCKDIETNEVFKFRPNSALSGHRDFTEPFISFCKEVKTWIGHNFLTYDMPTINHVFGQELIKPAQVIDTLVLSRLFRYSPASETFEYTIKINGEYYDSRVGGHGLAAWGTRLRFPKTDYNDWSKYTEEMGEYNTNDVQLNELIYKELRREKTTFQISDESIRLEHDITWMLHCQERDGFYLDRAKAADLRNETKRLLDEINTNLAIVFPPMWVLDKVLTLKINKDGTPSKVSMKMLERYQYNEDLKAELDPTGLSYNLLSKELFNPGSGQHIVKRLQAIGWKPTKFTEKGNPRTDRVTLQEAIKGLLIEHPDLPELRFLYDYDVVQDRNQRIEKWLELSSKDGRIHGKVMHIGAWTHRCSHYDDNMANVASVETGKGTRANFPDINFEDLKKFDPFGSNKRLLKLKGEDIEYAVSGLDGGFGWESRDVWGVPSNDDRVLVGCDASGIQLRALAHYMGDPEYIRALIDGDIHEVHRVALGIPSRAVAKTFIYAWLLGAGDEKVGSIIGVSPEEINTLIRWAHTQKKWKTTLLAQTQSRIMQSGRDPNDKKLIATILKGGRTKAEFLERIQALKTLRKKTIPKAVEKGFMKGMDGRVLWLPNEHLAMGAYLQGFEAVIMKKAMQLYQFKLKELGIWFKQVAFVHDEFQIETLRKDADTVGQTVVWAIKEAGKLYGSLCPLDGEYRIGQTWAQTH